MEVLDRGGRRGEYGVKSDSKKEFSTLFLFFVCVPRRGLWEFVALFLFFVFVNFLPALSCGGWNSLGWVVGFAGKRDNVQSCRERAFWKV